MKRAFVLLVSVLALTLTACNEHNPLAWEHGTVADITSTGNSMTLMVETSEGVVIVDIFHNSAYFALGAVNSGNTIGGLKLLLDRGMTVEFVTKWDTGEYNPVYNCEEHDYTVCHVDPRELWIVGPGDELHDLGGG